MPRVIDASQLSFGEGLAAGFFGSFDAEGLGQQVADRITPPKLTKVSNVGDRELSTDAGGSFFLDGVRQKEFPRELIGLADREYGMKRQAESNERAKASEQRQAARFGMETIADVMGIQRQAAIESRQRESHEWEREKYESTRRMAAKDQAVAAQERSAFMQVNQQYASQRLQGAQRLGMPIDPALGETLAVASEIMPPDKFKAMADSMFTAAMAGQNTSQLSAEVMQGYAATLTAQTKARAEVASMGTAEALRELNALQKSDTPDPEAIAEATSKLRVRQGFEQVSIMRGALAWKPGLPRSLSQYDMAIAAGNPMASRAEGYWRLAMQYFEALHGRSPMTPEDGLMVKALAEQMSSEDGWMP